MSFVVAGGGIWSAFPVLFPNSTLGFYAHAAVTAILALNTLFNFCLAALTPAGPSPHIEWGRYEVVWKKSLEGYKFCLHCSVPKPPNAHHCRSCGACVVDMDHHCPFTGYCVGASNHQNFLLFLVFTTASSFYVPVLTVYAGSKLSTLVRFHISNSPQVHLGVSFYVIGDILASTIFST